MGIITQTITGLKSSSLCFPIVLVRHKVTIQIHSKCQKSYIRPVKKSKYKRVKSLGLRIESFFPKKRSVQV